MPPRVGAGMKPIDVDTDIQYGMAFVVKYRNCSINQLDLWLGIHMPIDVARKVFKARQKKNESDDTPDAERSYLMYLPGRNTL